MPTLVSISVSRVRALGTPDAPDAMDRPWTTGFFKEPVVGAVRFDAEGVAGDEQADRVNHGGPEKAVLAYSALTIPIGGPNSDCPNCRSAHSART